MPLPLLWPPALAQPAAPRQQPKPLTRAQAEFKILEAYDDGLPIPVFQVGAKNRLGIAWLRAAAGEDPPTNPFPRGGGPFKEVEAALGFSNADPASWERRIQKQPLTLTGTQLAFWRWGRTQTRSGRLSPTLRAAWEDRLLQGGAPILRGLALRHALCWALAEGDDARFAILKDRHGKELQATFSAFQGLFAWVGGTTPRFRLWKLPDLTYEDQRLDQLGARRLWITPFEKELPSVPQGTLWIAPSARGETGPGEAILSATDRQEAETLAAQLKASFRQAWYAPQRTTWESAGLAYFPILIEFNDAHEVTSIRMGDAAPERP